MTTAGLSSCMNSSAESRAFFSALVSQMRGAISAEVNQAVLQRTAQYSAFAQSLHAETVVAENSEKAVGEQRDSILAKNHAMQDTSLGGLGTSQPFNIGLICRLVLLTSAAFLLRRPLRMIFDIKLHCTRNRICPTLLWNNLRHRSRSLCILCWKKTRIIKDTAPLIQKRL